MPLIAPGDFCELLGVPRDVDEKKIMIPFAKLRFVVVEELIPESHRSPNHDLATLAALTGFVVMMILDLAFR